MPQKSNADHKRLMRVEVQFRTISMDWWASLEHKIRYKKGLQESATLKLPTMWIRSFSSVPR